MSLAEIYLDLSIYTISVIIILFILIIETRKFYILYGRSQSPEVVLATVVSEDASTNTSVKSSQMTKTEDSTRSRTTSVPVSKKNLILDTLTIFIYFSYIIAELFYIFATNGFSLFGSCVLMDTTLDYIFYTIAKAFLYLMFLYRLYVVYNNPVLGRSTKVLKIVSVLTILWMFASIIAKFIYHVTDELNIDGNIFCIVHEKSYNPLVVLIIIPYDLFINIFCCYLFIQPLKNLTKMQNDKSTEKFKYLIKKYTILTLVAVISTFILLFSVLIFQINGFSAIDGLINSICVMFYTQAYDKYYGIICCGAERCGSSMIRKCCSKE
eukprot:266841_1